jgi:serine/threonine protein kinase
MLELEGTMLGHYRLQRRLNRGGMSEVYLATDEHSQQDVAVKLVDSSDVEYSERFQREVKTISALAHSHILPVLDYGQQGSCHYLVMPYIKQGTLRDRLANGPLRLQEASIILEQVANALQFAHDRGIIHRDIKPSNLLLQSEQYIYLADFGLAKTIGVEDHNDITQSGCIMGTPEYMAPELVDQPASVSSDIYALGVLLYEMLTGRVPFKGATPIATCWKHLGEQPIRPSMLNPVISHPLEEVILCALEKKPRRRFKSVQAFVQAYKSSLQATEEPETIVAVAQLLKTNFYQAMPVQPAILRRTYRIAGTPKMVVALIVLVLLFTLSLSLGFLTASNDSRLQASTTLGAIVPFSAGNDMRQKRVIPRLPTTPKNPLVTNSSSDTQNSPHNNDSGRRHGKGNRSEQSNSYGYGHGPGNGNGYEHGHGRGHGPGNGDGHGHDNNDTQLSD